MQNLWIPKFRVSLGSKVIAKKVLCKSRNSTRLEAKTKLLSSIEKIFPLVGRCYKCNTKL